MWCELFLNKDQQFLKIQLQDNLHQEPFLCFSIYFLPLLVGDWVKEILARGQLELVFPKKFTIHSIN